LSRAATPGKGRLDAPNSLNIKGQAEACLPAVCVIKTGCKGLQRRFDALLQAGTLRLKATYLVAGLILKRQSMRFLA
jgi:hypothetical protein